MNLHLDFGAGLKPAASDEAFRQTFLGQAHIAGTGPAGKTCRECAFWHQWRTRPADGCKQPERVACSPGRYGKEAAESLQGTLKRARCNRPIANKANRLVPPNALACRLFEQNPSAPPAVKTKAGDNG